MTQPVSFNPARAVGERRIAVAPKSETAVASLPAQTAVPSMPLSKLTSLAHDLAAEGPPYDLARIAQVSQAIASGDYRIEVAAIADAMLRRMPPADQ
jgi:flagellar biosynthesis anti-sigma factor FlgM